MIQYIIVFLVIGIAVAYALYRLWTALSVGKSGGGGFCSGCSGCQLSQFAKCGEKSGKCCDKVDGVRDFQIEVQHSEVILKP